MASFDLKKVVAERLGENYELHEKYINPTLVKVFRTIGFDRVYTKAKGQYLWDKDGNRYLDMLSGFGVYSIGRNHPQVAQVIRDVLDLDLPNMVQMDCAFLAGLLAEALVKHCPPHLEAVFFCNSGTEAVEASLKFARAATGRSKFAYLDHGWHGLTLGSLSIMGNEEFRDGFGEMLPGVEVPYGDLEALERIAVEEGHRGAGGGMYPRQGGADSGGGLPAGGAGACAASMGRCSSVTRCRQGTGARANCFRLSTGTWSLISFSTSKALSGGYVPVGAMITRRCDLPEGVQPDGPLLGAFVEFWPQQTRHGGRVGHVAYPGRREAGGAQRHAGPETSRRGQRVEGRHEVLMEARGKGCMIGIEFHEPRSLKMKVAWKMVHAAHDGLFAQMVVMPLLEKHHVLTQVSGNHGDIIRVLPAFVITDEDIQYFVHALNDVLSDCYKLPGPMCGIWGRIW